MMACRFVPPPEINAPILIVIDHLHYFMNECQAAMEPALCAGDALDPEKILPNKWIVRLSNRSIPSGRSATPRLGPLKSRQYFGDTKNVSPNWNSAIH
jgi:hypothetical protein